jgi:hypothetical protein
MSIFCEHALIDVDERDVNKYTALMYAVQANNVPCTQALLDVGADPTVRHVTTGDTLLHMAARFGEQKLCATLLSASMIDGKRIAYLSVKNLKGYNPLQWATLYSKPELTRYLECATVPTASIVPEHDQHGFVELNIPPLLQSQQPQYIPQPSIAQGQLYPTLSPPTYQQQQQR